MRRLAACLLAAAIAALALAPAASAEFGFRDLEVTISEPGAGVHPEEMATTMDMQTVLDGGLEFPDGQLRDLEVDLPEGFVGSPTAVRRCASAQFIAEQCPDESAVGYVAVKAEFDPIPPGSAAFFHVPVYNLAPAPGAAAKLGFDVLGVSVPIDLHLRTSYPYNVYAKLRNTSQAALFYASRLTVWGDPSNSAHNSLRGDCLNDETAGEIDEPSSTGSCPVEPQGAFITSPRSCGSELRTHFRAIAWNTGKEATGTAITPPRQLCSKLGFGPEISSEPSTERADAPTGLAFEIEVTDPGLTSTNPGATAHSDIERARVTLPEGMTINPSQAEGLEVCSKADLEDERPDSRFGEGCPAASKIGDIEVTTPLLEGETFSGQLFVAEPRDNLADDSLIALYIVIRDRERGILIAQPAKVTPDPETGQLITVTERMPQVPLGSVRLRLRSGARSPLVTPPRCGDYEIEARFTPSAGGADHTSTSEFEIDAGPGGGPCPSGGAGPFDPGFAAGALNNAAGAFSPFLMRLTRKDGDQDLTRFSAVLPEGIVPRLAGVPWCPDALIALARGRDGVDERRSPSCPAASRIGGVLAGAGVGSQLTHVPGSLYLAGPYKGAPLSAVAIVPAVAGPFDVGTVVTRVGLKLNPTTYRGEVDGAASDPIPHILAGIPLRVRDIRVHADRPAFTLNPTSCAPMATLATIWGGGRHVFSSADDVPVGRGARFQAAGCAALAFKPRLGLRLKGGTRRGDHPALRATYAPRAAHANLARLALTFPRSEFVENANFRTICTRVQFAAEACPKAAIYGRAVAHSPLLDAPLRGPVYLRSSNNLLPDAVFDLKGIVDVEVAVRIDAVKGRLRATVQDAPDVPVSRVVVQMQGGRKGLFVNSRDICKGANRAAVRTRGHNGARTVLRPKLRPAGCKQRGKQRQRRARR